MKLWEWRGRIRPLDDPFNPTHKYSPEKPIAFTSGPVPPEIRQEIQRVENRKELDEHILDALSLDRDTAWPELVHAVRASFGFLEEHTIRYYLTALLKFKKVRCITRNVYRLPPKKPPEPITYRIDKRGRRYPSRFIQHDALDACIVAQLSDRHAVQSKDLRRAVLDDYGTVNERVLYNHIAKLVAKGTILRTSGDDDLGSFGGYYRLPKRRGPESEDSSP